MTELTYASMQPLPTSCSILAMVWRTAHVIVFHMARSCMMKPQEQNNLVFKTSHAGKPIDWAVGAMIYEINQDGLHPDQFRT